MQLPEDAVLPGIYLGESDRWQHQPLYEAIVLRARELHLAGAPLARPDGFRRFQPGAHRQNSPALDDLPMVIEIVVTEEKVNALLPLLDVMMGGGLVTMERSRSGTTGRTRVNRA